MNFSITVIIVAAIQILVGVLIGAYLHRMSKDYPVIETDNNLRDQLPEKRKLTIRSVSFDQHGAGNSADSETVETDKVNARSDSSGIPIDKP